jgi:16S rRNA (uracil1498-N3)-methyltransferase
VINDVVGKSRGGSSAVVNVSVMDKIKALHDELNLNCTLYFSPIKTKRLKIMLEKATELGITDFQPVITQNTNVDLTPSDLKSLTAVITEAAEQSERQTVPRLHNRVSFKSFLSESQLKKKLLLVCLERSNSKDILTALTDIKPLMHSMSTGIVCGPEGGFSAEEINEFQRMEDDGGGSRLIPVSLGPNILRAETAAIYALSCLSAVSQRHVSFNILK